MKNTFKNNQYNPKQLRSRCRSFSHFVSGRKIYPQLQTLLLTFSSRHFWVDNTSSCCHPLHSEGENKSQMKKEKKKVQRCKTAWNALAHCPIWIPLPAHLRYGSYPCVLQNPDEWCLPDTHDNQTLELIQASNNRISNWFFTKNNFTCSMYVTVSKPANHIRKGNKIKGIRFPNYHIKSNKHTKTQNKMTMMGIIQEPLWGWSGNPAGGDTAATTTTKVPYRINTI